ncbi:hypothetical protein CC1G_15360 [Coprinopsis cinerea okayama7|uniref:Uncharacterized protein n=1 Tax=Coprinopsis cinerea (strain Okayama-7 / 130 / ATCC MYA-4618 / FGSC 9003) TaxID=240176 RepID=D6RQ39_COPC7|nr:hypothetical protein CC1G_15360 [Coprinopsis cinerea okayama7\|eukprot:XP_002910453.1 hypothetical protein CC1G_15360 [Coprinopsis cinerea okayama7\
MEAIQSPRQFCWLTSDRRSLVVGVKIQYIYETATWDSFREVNFEGVSERIIATDRRGGLPWSVPVVHRIRIPDEQYAQFRWLVQVDAALPYLWYGDSDKPVGYHENHSGDISEWKISIDGSQIENGEYVWAILSAIIILVKEQCDAV